MFKRHKTEMEWITPNDQNIEITIFDLDKEILPFISDK